MKKISILLFAIFFISCNLFEKPIDDSANNLIDTRGSNLSGHQGTYDEYFFPLEKKLNLKYSTNLNPEFNNSDTLNLQTFPEYLLYISPDSTQYESLMYDLANDEFVDFSYSVVNDTTFDSTIVVSSPRHKDYSTLVWDSAINRYKGSVYVDHGSCEDGEESCLSVDYIGDYGDNTWFDPTTNRINVNDPFVFNKTIKVLNNVSDSLFSYLDLSDFDTTITRICESDTTWFSADSMQLDCVPYQDYVIYEFKYGVLGEDSTMFLDFVANDTIIGELPDNPLIDINGDTIRTFIPDQEYTLLDGSVITPVVWETTIDTVFKPYTNYKEMNMLLENHIIDYLTDDSYTYNVMKSSVGWLDNQDLINSSDYFVYRQDSEAIYELVYPSFFNYYGGIWNEQTDDFDDNGWTNQTVNMDSSLFYLPFRDGERVQKEFSLVFDDPDPETGNQAQYNFKTDYQVTYGDVVNLSSININGQLHENYELTDVFKVVRDASMTMVGSSVTYNEKQTYWLAKDSSGIRGIVKQTVEYSWGDYEMVTGLDWEMERYNESEPSSPIILNSLDELAKQFGEERFIPKKSSGISKFSPKFN